MFEAQQHFEIVGGREKYRGSDEVSSVLAVMVAVRGQTVEKAGIVLEVACNLGRHAIGKRALDAPCEYILRTALGRGLQSTSKFPRRALRSDQHGASGHIAPEQQTLGAAQDFHAFRSNMSSTTP